VNITSAKGNNITITKDLAAKVMKATVEGQTVRIIVSILHADLIVMLNYLGPCHK